MSQRFILIAPDSIDENSDLVKNIARLIQAAGDYTVQVEPPNATALLHVAIGLLTGAGDGGHTTPTIPGDDGEVEVGTGADVMDIADAEDDTPVDDTPVDDFTFESLGTVNLDGELIEAVLNPNSEKNVLEVADLELEGSTVKFSINESSFKHYLNLTEGLQAPEVVHRITVNNQSELVDLTVKSAQTTRLVIGTMHSHLFTK